MYGHKCADLEGGGCPDLRGKFKLNKYYQKESRVK